MTSSIFKFPGGVKLVLMLAARSPLGPAVFNRIWLLAQQRSVVNFTCLFYKKCTLVPFVKGTINKIK